MRIDPVYFLFLLILYPCQNPEKIKSRTEVLARFPCRNICVNFLIKGLNLNFYLETHLTTKTSYQNIISTFIVRTCGLPLKHTKHSVSKKTVKYFAVWYPNSQRTRFKKLRWRVVYFQALSTHTVHISYMRFQSLNKKIPITRPIVRSSTPNERTNEDT